jgi:hypothetical protein
MKKQAFLITIVFLISVFYVSASIESLNTEEYYEIGEDLVFDVKIIPEVDAQALFSVELICEEFTIMYQKMPLELKENQPITLKTEPFKALEKAKGTCITDFYLDSVLGAKLEKGWTKSFEIVDEKPKEEPEEVLVINETEEELEIIEDVKEEEVIEEVKGNKGWIYFLIILILIGVITYFYFKYKPFRKNSFNRGWKF